MEVMGLQDSEARRRSSRSCGEVIATEISAPETLVGTHCPLRPRLRCGPPTSRTQDPSARAVQPLTGQFPDRRFKPLYVMAIAPDDPGNDHRASTRPACLSCSSRITSPRVTPVRIGLRSSWSFCLNAQRIEVARGDANKQTDSMGRPSTRQSAHGSTGREGPCSRQ